MLQPVLHTSSCPAHTYKYCSTVHPQPVIQVCLSLYCTYIQVLQYCTTSACNTGVLPPVLHTPILYCTYIQVLQYCTPSACNSGVPQPVLRTPVLYCTYIQVLQYCTTPACNSGALQPVLYTPFLFFSYMYLYRMVTWAFNEIPHACLLSLPKVEGQRVIHLRMVQFTVVTLLSQRLVTIVFSFQFDSTCEG